jgi:hypothetical protein
MREIFGGWPWPDKLNPWAAVAELTRERFWTTFRGMDLDLVKSEILQDVFREGMTMPIPASERPLPARAGPATWPAKVLSEARQAEKLTSVKTPLPKFFNPLFRKQNLVNRSLIASTRAGADGLAEMMWAADKLINEMEVLRRLVFAGGVEANEESISQLRQAARGGDSIVALPWVMRQTTRLAAGATVLISGCVDNLLNLELASLGFKVIGLDERECRDDHPNFKFLEGSRSAPPLAEATVDAVIAIGGVGQTSTGALAVSPPDEADLAAMRAWQRVLKPGGALMLTIPFGKTTPTAAKRPYDSGSLDNLLKGWMVEVREFAVCATQQCWIYPTPESEAARTTVSQTGRAQSVALVLARK